MASFAVEVHCGLRLFAPSPLASLVRSKVKAAQLSAATWSRAPYIPLPFSPFPVAGGRRSLSTTTACHARLIRRPIRPYQFTQIVQLSDGSTFTVRTTSPHPLYRCTKDSRNHYLWQPSEKSLRNTEADEAGKLAAFRSRFGHSWDAEAVSGEDAEAVEADAKLGKTAESLGAASGKPDAEEVTDGAAGPDAFDMLADLLSGYAENEKPIKGGTLSSKKQERKKK